MAPADHVVRSDTRPSREGKAGNDSGQAARRRIMTPNCWFVAPSNQTIAPSRAPPTPPIQSRSGYTPREARAPIALAWGVVPLRYTGLPRSRRGAGRGRGAGDVVPRVKISEASRLSGVSARSLRYYEDEGLIVPGRCSNGYRDYCGSTIDRVLVIRSLLESGLPVRLIKEALSDLIEDAGTVALRTEYLQLVEEYRDRLAARIADLGARQAALDAYLREARQTHRG
jgi:DNA-binding transcriptional MerR regulator